MFTGGNDLMQFALKKQQQEAQDKLIKAQSQALKDEARLVQNKYGNGHPDLFATIGHNLDDAMLGFCSKLDKDLRAKNGFTQELNIKVRNSGLDQQQQKFVADIQSHKQILDIGRQQVLACKTMSQADGIFNKLEGEHHNFFDGWKKATTEMSAKWLKQFDTLVEGANNIPPVNNQNQGLQQALQKIQELEQKLIQSQQETEALKLQVVEQCNAIGGLREENIVKTNKITDQSIKIMDLYEKVSATTEESNINNIKFIEEKHRVDEFKYKIDTYKTHFNHFIEHHKNIDGQDQLVDMLGDLNIEQV